jgi:hypothetical protein
LNLRWRLLGSPLSSNCARRKKSKARSHGRESKRISWPASAGQPYDRRHAARIARRLSPRQGPAKRSNPVRSRPSTRLFAGRDACHRPIGERHAARDRRVHTHRRGAPRTLPEPFWRLVRLRWHRGAGAPRATASRRALRYRDSVRPDRSMARDSALRSVAPRSPRTPPRQPPRSAWRPARLSLAVRAPRQRVRGCVRKAGAGESRRKK